MPKYLTEEWLALQAELAASLPERPGVTARVQYLVSGGPDGEVAFVTAVQDGRLVESVLGTDPDADVTLAQGYADSVAISRGELDPNAAFMQGRTKVTGNMGRLMALIPLTVSEEYKSVQADLAAQTEF